MKCEYCGTDLVIFSGATPEELIKAGVKQVECENFLDGGLCRVFIEDEVARIGREGQCYRQEKNSCCYTCINQKKCDISCDILDQTKIE